MKYIKISYLITRGGILTVSTVIFQSMPVFIPGVGLFISPFSTLPIAIACYINQTLGFMVLLASFLILNMVHFQEAFLLVFTTGLLGITLGINYKNNSKIKRIGIPSFSLTLGMSILTLIVKIPVFGSLTEHLSFGITIMIFFLFSLIYVLIWNQILRLFINRLVKIKNFKDLFENKDI